MKSSCSARTWIRGSWAPARSTTAATPRSPWRWRAPSAPQAGRRAAPCAWRCGTGGGGAHVGPRGWGAYVRAHRAELDRVVAYVNFDGGIGHVTGYTLGGRKDIEAAVREVLKPVESWGMNAHTLDASGGTDHVD